MLDPETQARYQAEYDRLTAQHGTLSAELDAALGTASVEDYSFQDAEGQQRVRRRDPEKLFVLLERIEKRLKWLSDKLGGRGLTAVVSRRHP